MEKKGKEKACDGMIIIFTIIQIYFPSIHLVKGVNLFILNKYIDCKLIKSQ